MTEHWYINPIAGHDNNDGRGESATHCRPLKTFRRLFELLPVLTEETLIHVLAENHKLALALTAEGIAEIIAARDHRLKGRKR